MAIAEDKTNDIVNEIPEVKEEKAVEKPTAKLPTEDVIDIDLSATEKRTFRINGDNNRLVKLNPSDVSVITRVEEASKKYDKCIEDLQALAEHPSETEEDLYDLGKKFKDIDNRMRDLLDYIFQSNVSDVCVPEGSGSMYDPVNGKYRYEYVLEALLQFYTSNIQNEYKKMNATVAKRTAKYTGKSNKKK